MRDPALASVMGALPGSDFGSARTRRAASPAGRRGTATFGDMGFGFGGDDMGFGAEAMAVAAPAHAAHHAHHAGHSLSPEQMRALHHHQLMQHHTMNRALLLDPNRYSTLKVQGYSFSLNSPGLLMGTAFPFSVTLQPNSKIRPKRMVANVPQPLMITLSAVQVANVNVLIGTNDDAYIYGPNSFGLENEFPTLDTSTRATMTGSYSGYTPTGFATGFPWTFVLTFQGPAALAGNG